MPEYVVHMVNDVGDGLFAGRNCRPALFVRQVGMHGRGILGQHEAQGPAKLLAIEGERFRRPGERYDLNCRKVEAFPEQIHIDKLQDFPGLEAPENLGAEREIGRASCRERVYVLV